MVFGRRFTPLAVSTVLAAALAVTIPAASAATAAAATVAPGAPGADEADARSILARRNEDRREFLALHVNADDVQPGFKYRVSRGKLTAENPSRRPARSDAPQTVRRARRRETRRR